MFRIRQVRSVTSRQGAQDLATVLHIYTKAFAYYPEYASKISDLVLFKDRRDFEVLLLVAESQKNRIVGFALVFIFPQLKYAYLDYIATDPDRRARGYGIALYNAVREHLQHKRCKGFFMDVPSDDVAHLKDPSRIKINEKRMAFYEALGARPVMNTLYEKITTKANQGYMTMLVYDDFGNNKPVSRESLQQVMQRIFEVKIKGSEGDKKVQKVIDSVQDDPIQLREAKYAKRSVRSKARVLSPLTLINGGDANQIHHLKEVGYVERPARISAVLAGLKNIPVEEIAVKPHSEQHIKAVHDHKLVQFIKDAQTQLTPRQLLYPNVFPVRNPEHIPKTWDMRAGYYCIDTFTPLTVNAYTAARNAVNAALTGADALIAGDKHAYVLCRPPGHHAERKVFGGFCYFNSAAVAAHFLARKGKVAFLDIDYHHGNGSQDIFYEREDVFFASIHGHPSQAYPYYAGYEDEVGEGKGKGFNKNFPLRAGTQDDAYCKSLQAALKVLMAHQPSYFVLSLGFDIMKGDPTGAFEITNKGMRRVGEILATISCPILVVQEGGYSLKNLRSGAFEFFNGLLYSSQ